LILYLVSAGVNSAAVYPAVLITSIPVVMIVVRYNFLRGNICSKPWAIFWSLILPWIIVIPFQTNVRPWSGNPVSALHY
jgi:hypothetical protein